MERDCHRLSAQGHLLSGSPKGSAFLCQIYERHLSHTLMRFYPPVKKNRPVWLARVRTLEGRGQREDDPTVLHMAAYLLTLDELYDEQAAKLKQQTRRAEDAEVMVRRLQVKLALPKLEPQPLKATRPLPLRLSRRLRISTPRN